MKKIIISFDLKKYLIYTFLFRLKLQCHTSIRKTFGCKSFCESFDNIVNDKTELDYLSHSGKFILNITV